MHTDNEKKKIKRVRVVTIPHPQEPTAPPKKKRSLKRIAFFNFLLLCIALFTLRTVSIAYVSMEKFIVHNTLAWYHYQFETLATEHGYTKEKPLPPPPKGFTIKSEIIALMKELNMSAGLYPFVRAMVYHESRDDIYAKSPAGCVGLGQIHPDTAKKFGYRIEQMYNPKLNLKVMVTWVNLMLMSQKEDLLLAMMEYNSGKSRMWKSEENRNYVQNVLRDMLKLPPSELIWEDK